MSFFFSTIKFVCHKINKRSKSIYRETERSEKYNGNGDGDDVDDDNDDDDYENYADFDRLKRPTDKTNFL